MANKRLILLRGDARVTSASLIATPMVPQASRFLKLPPRKAHPWKLPLRKGVKPLRLVSNHFYLSVRSSGNATAGVRSGLLTDMVPQGAQLPGAELDMERLRSASLRSGAAGEWTLSRWTKTRIEPGSAPGILGANWAWRGVCFYAIVLFAVVAGPQCEEDAKKERRG